MEYDALASCSTGQIFMKKRIIFERLTGTINVDDDVEKEENNEKIGLETKRRISTYSGCL